MANIDNSVIAENLTQLLQNSVNMTSVFYDIFLNPEPMDVELQQYNYKGSYAAAYKVIGDLTEATSATRVIKIVGDSAIPLNSQIEIKGTEITIVDENEEESTVTIDGFYTVVGSSVSSGEITITVAEPVIADFSGTGAIVGSRLGTVKSINAGTGVITIINSGAVGEGDTIYLKGLSNTNNYTVSGVSLEVDLMNITVSNKASLRNFTNIDKIDTIFIPNRAKDRKIALTGEGSPEGVVTANVGAVYVDESVEISAENPNGNGIVYFKAVGSGNTGWVTVLTSEGVNEYVRTYLATNNFVTINNVASYLTTNNYMTETDVNAKFEAYNPTIPMITLTGVSGDQSLADNTGYSMTVTGSTNFFLPVPTDTSILHKIFIQLSMSPAQTIQLAQSGVTLNYFDGIIPTMSASGLYNIMYEYDNAASRWVVGVLYKGTV